jgi:hypothetical protein
MSGALGQTESLCTCLTKIESHEIVLVLPEEEKYTCKSDFPFQI